MPISFRRLYDEHAFTLNFTIKLHNYRSSPALGVSIYVPTRPTAANTPRAAISTVRMYVPNLPKHSAT
jgi:hypothetical protein